MQVLLLVTGTTHATFALAATEAMRLLGVHSAGLWGVSLALALVFAFHLQLRRLFPDRPRSAFTLHLIEEPYFAHWCAALGACVPIALYGIVKAIASSVRGLPFEPPTTFALVAYLAALSLAVWGVFVRRRWVTTRKLDLVIPGLPREFDGYRVAQLSDLHIGGLTPRRWGEAWADISNAAAPDLVVVTGDMVSSGVGFHDDIAQVIGRLRADDGVFVSMGNHDYFGDGEPLVTLLRAKGIIVLRNEGTTLARGDARLFVAGVDDTWTRRANLHQTLEGRTPGAFTLLLAHDPALFLEAAKQGANLVLSGHTHGGQVAIPFFPKLLSLGKLAHRFHLGLYREGDATLYVHPGLGTTGPPIRLGVAPEVAIFTLRTA